MLRLRQYKACDAKAIVSWIKDETALKKWSSDRFGDFPISEADINKKYFENNGDCAEEDNFYPVTAFDESGVVGHMIMRFTDDKKEVLRFILLQGSRLQRGWRRILRYFGRKMEMH